MCQGRDGKAEYTMSGDGKWQNVEPGRVSLYVGIENDKLWGQKGEKCHNVEQKMVETWEKKIVKFWSRIGKTYNNLWNKNSKMYDQKTLQMQYHGYVETDIVKWLTFEVRKHIG